MRSPEQIKENADPLMAAEYVFEEINHDLITLNNPVHQKMLKEYEMNYLNEQFNAEKHFLYHPDERISKLTSDLLTEKYTLSKIHSKIKKVESDADRLHDYVTRIMFEFKNSLMLDIIKDKLISLKIASENKDIALADQLMQELREMDIVKRDLAKHLGVRIITKL
jgi:DNA primase